MTTELSPASWLALDTLTRIKIAELFGIPQRRPSHVSDMKVVDSGHDWKDLESITVERMRNVLGSNETDYQTLWAKLVDHVRGVVAQHEEDIPVPPPPSMSPALVPTKPTKKSIVKKAKTKARGK